MRTVKKALLVVGVIVLAVVGVVLEPASGRVLWSTSGARAGWSRESLAGAAQKVLRELVGDLRLE